MQPHTHGQYPSGWTINSGQGTSSISVTVGSSSGNVCATPFNSSCEGTQGCISVTVTPLPGLCTISGNSIICSGDTEPYTASASDATSYTWTIPSDWTINSGQGTSSISVTVGSSSGNVCVTPYNNDCEGTQGCKSITVNPLPTPNITGKALVCTNETDVSYSTSYVEGNSYYWDVYNGTITSGQNTSQIFVDWEISGTGTIRLTDTVNATGCYTKTDGYNVNIKFLDSLEILLKFNAVLICKNLENAFVNYQWYNQNGLIPGETRQFYESTFPLNGEYYVIATDNNNCPNKSNHLIFPIAKSGEIYVFPNPTKNRFKIVINNEDYGEVLIRVYNTLGKKLNELISNKGTQFFETEVSVQGLYPGVYVVEIIVGKDNKYYEKVMVE